MFARCSLFVSTILLVSPWVYADLPGAGDDEGQVVLYRDTWGVPHIYAPTVEGGMFAMGYAQAEDRPDQLFMNLASAMGETSSYAGPSQVMQDTVVRMFDHYGMSKKHVDTVDPCVRSHVQAFVAGMNAWFEAHPEDVPAWWQHETIDEYMVMAFGRLFLYSWSIDDGFGDLKRAGIQPGVDRTRRGSNQWAVAPERSANGAAILYVDPHLAWFGPSRFWEFRIHAGDLHGSGFTLAGQPYIGLGHNADLSWAMTTGGPDTADIFELTLNPDNPLQYKYDNEWRGFTTRQTTIPVRGEEPRETTLYFSHHGPIVAMRDGKAYAHKTAYYDIVDGNEAWLHLNFATDYTGAVDAMAESKVFPQNVMVADTAGNIYYQRTGRVPVRASGYDWSKPVDGSTSATEWQGVHPATDHVQVLNPPRGYMQNCNIPPDAMMVDSPMQPEQYLGYVFSDLGYGARGGWSNSRGGRAVEILEHDDSMTVQEALEYALDVEAMTADRWIELLAWAHGRHGRRYRDDALYNAAIDNVLAWDGRVTRHSAEALQYHYWRDQLNRELGNDDAKALRAHVDQYFALSVGDGAPLDVEGATLRAMAKAFSEGMARLVEDWGRLDTPYGAMFRVGRDDNSWPIGGGGIGDTVGRTLRSISFAGTQEDGTRRGRAGQTSTQIIVMTKPVQSWTQPPIGQSDRPGSPHYDDQAERLASKRIMKPTWWLPADLKDHVKSRVVLEGP